jgi:DNA-binding NarL/FixJ family response regulator
MVEGRALIIDDDRSWQAILGEILQDEGLDVDYASSLEEARSQLRNQTHRLAVVDLSLDPEDHRNQDGLAVLEAVSRMDPTCTAILLSGFTTVEVTVNALTGYGAFTVQRKETFRRSQFRQVIRQALASPKIGATSGQASANELSSLAQEEQPSSVPGAALVVDDDAGWRSIIKEILEDAGYHVRQCVSYGEALGRLRREKFRLAVIDLSLTGASVRGTGWDIAGEDLEGSRLLVSVRAAGTPAIVVSGITAPEEIERIYQEQGVFAYIEKQSFDRRSFLNTVVEAGSQQPPSGELAVLTDRERQVLELVGKGMTNKEIAEKLVISTNTVKRHLKAIFEKLHIHTRSAAAAKAVDKKEN